MQLSDLRAALGGAALSFEVAPGVVLMLRPLTMGAAGEYNRFRREHPDDNVQAVCKLVALSATLPDGSALSEEVVSDLPAAAVDKIAARIVELNGWGDKAGN